MIENWVQWQDVFNYDPTPQPTERNLSPRPISPINPIKYSTNLQLYESGEEQKATKVNQHHGKENQIKVSEAVSILTMERPTPDNISKGNST